MERHLVYLFLAAHREHSIPRQIQMLSSELLQKNFSFWQHPNVKVTTQKRQKHSSLVVLLVIPLEKVLSKVLSRSIEQGYGIDN